MDRTVLLIVLIILLTISIGMAAIPRELNYQGKLTDENDVALTGTHEIIFYLMVNQDPADDTPGEGDTLWAETLDVDIVNGLFDVTLGTTRPIGYNFIDVCYLELVVDAETMVPREERDQGYGPSGLDK